MSIFAIAFAAFLGGNIGPIELWRMPPPTGYAEVPVFNRIMHAPSPTYFSNMKTGCSIVAEDIKGIAVCRKTVEMMDNITTLLLAEVTNASLMRSDPKSGWRASLKAAHASAVKFEKLYEPLLQQYPALHAIGLGGHKIWT